MKTTTKFLGVLAGAIALAGTAQAKDLRLGDFQTTTHIVSTEGTLPWMEKVTAATNGALTFQHFPAQQAAKADGLLDAVNSGILDAALIGTIYHGDTLPMNSVIGLPGFYGSAVEGTEAFQALLADGPIRDEIVAQGVVPLFGFVLPPYQVLAKKRLGTPEDFHNVNLRTSGATQAMTARSLGGVGVSIPGPEVYTAVERGRLDGILFPLASVPGYKLNEVVSHISLNGSFGGYSFVMVVKQNVFDALSPEEQKAMTDAGNEIAARVAKAQDDSITTLAEEWRGQGIDVYEFTPEELAKLTEAMAEVRTDWIARIGGGSDTAKAVVERYDALTGN